MNKKRISLLLVLSLLLIALATGCGGGNSDVATDTEEPIVLKLGHTGVIDHYYQEGSVRFAEIVNEKTDGRVTIEVYPSDQLGKQRESVEGCQLGTQDMVLTSTMVLSNFNKSIGVFDMPFLFEDREAAFAAMDGDVAKEIEANFENDGLVFLGWWENGFRHITNDDRPIEKPDDLKGLKIRVPESPVFIDTFTTLGAAATPIAFGELFSALQLNTVDGQENPASHVITQRFFEVQEHISLTNHFYTPEPLVMSKIVYDGLPEDVQVVLKEAGKEAGDYAREQARLAEEKYLKEIEEVGMIITQPDIKAFKEAVQPVYDKYEAEYGSLLTDLQNLSK